MKRIWIVATGEPLPMDGENARLYRAGLLAREMAARGYEVTWWTTSFDHIHKRQRQLPAELAWEKVQIRTLTVPGYRRNVSFRRLFDHLVGGWGAARAFSRVVASERPDVIVVSLPTLELCVAAAWYGRKTGTPVLVDVRDWWPDYFMNPFPTALHPLLRIPLAPYFWMARFACRNASAIAGISEPFVDWGLRHAGRVRGELDRCHYFTYVADQPAETERAAAVDFWDKRGVNQNYRGLRLCFLGTLATSMDLDTVIDAVQRARKRGVDTEFIICGDGEDRERLESRHGALPGIVFAGHVDRPKLIELMSRSNLAVAPYRPETSFEATISNKMVEYLAGGLPVLTSLQAGAFATLLDREHCGATYRSGAPETLAAMLCELSDDRTRLTKMAHAAKAAFDQHFEYNKVMDGWQEHLDMLCSGNAEKRDDPLPAGVAL